MYTVKSGDTAYSVSQSQQLSTNELININGLTYNVSNFPTSGTLCIQNQCSVYVVKQNDTCTGITAANNVTYTQLTSWNPQINGNCSNLGDMVKQTLCLSNPLGNFLAANNTNTGTYTTPAPVPSPVGPNTTTNCGKYYDVETGDTCASVSLKFNIALNDFYFLNPEINSNCTNLWLDTNYCVAPVGSISTYPGYGGTTSTFSITPASSTPVAFVDLTASNATKPVIVPIANQSRTDCWDYFWVNSSLATGFTCWDVAKFSGLSSEQFVLWNPSLDQNPVNATTKTYNYNCTLTPSMSYCNVLASPTATPSPTIVPPSPRAAGEISNCTAWLQVSDGIDCPTILSGLRMDISIFYKMNPSVNSDCSGLTAGTYYCYSCNADQLPGIVEPSYTGNGTATATSSPTSTGTAVVTPTPTQSGMVGNCNKFHYVVKNDTCYDIAQNASIPLNTFYTWNPAVKTDCSALQIGYYVCIGIIPSSSSTTSTTSKPGTTTTSKTTTGTTGTTSKTTTSSSSSKATATLSPDGTCGGTKGYTCQPGNCCSKYGSCGTTSDFCAAGCQKAYGTCKISTDGTCGGSAGNSCQGSGFGDCCSSAGKCGSTSAFCGSGCQTTYGTCNISTDGTCGGSKGMVCTGSGFGNCCSQYNSCGSSSDYCGTGCQKSFGTCS